MSYQVLYRTYRPRTFDDVIGQDHITIALQNQIKNGQISHAYLFTGTRGTGKTSIAKVFAKAINCENHDKTPCLTCDTCNQMENSMDIVEIDAASNNRVDEIRDLRESVKYPPISGKYKVYIIDEVHMLTDSAFNALLKTLEEPPKYVVFILATTEVQKLPATILSRCMRFDFRLVDEDTLTKHLKKIFDSEHIAYEDTALSLIARLGEGSVRDTLSIADMCVAYTNRYVTYDKVVEAVGATDRSVLSAIVSQMLHGDIKSLIASIEKTATNGKNISVLSKDIAGYLRDLAVAKTCDNFMEILRLPQSVGEKLRDISKDVAVEDILQGLKVFSSLEQEFRYTTNPKVLFEVTALSVASGRQSSIRDLEDRISAIEKKLDMVKP